jgi:hypothetical protein
MNIELQPELDNQIKQEINSYYKILNVSQQGSLPNFTTSKNQILIEIPSDIVFNPSLLSLSFSVTHGGAVGINAIPSVYIPWFSRCELYSSSNNIRLVDVQNLDIYNKMSIGLYENFLKNQDNYLYTTNRTTLGNTTPLTSDYFVDSGVVSDRLLTYDVNLLAPSTGTVIPKKTYTIKLCDLISNSFFSINRNIYSSSILYLRLETNTLSNIIFSIADGGVVSTAYSAETLTLNSLSLNVYCEANPDLINIARQQQGTKEGLSLVLPEIQNAQYSISNSAGSRGSIVKVVNNSSADARLYMVLSCLTNVTNKADCFAINNMSNHEDAKYNQVQLYINSNQLCNLDTTLLQDLAYVDNIFENHSFNTNLSFKNLSPFVYSFSSKKIKDNKHDGNLLDGVTYPQNGEITLNITYNCVGATANKVANPTANTSFNHNIFTVTKRKIYLKDGKFSYVPFV